MRKLLTGILRNCFARICKRKMENALGLHLRGEGRTDGLRLEHSHTRLEIMWRARAIHPWDGDNTAEERAHLFVLQTLTDADAALSRLFTFLPQIDSVDLRVTDPLSGETIMRGLVFRASLASKRPRSDHMWLGQLGVQFRITGNRFEPLEFSKAEVYKTA
jgi:hypothetical protein